MKEGRKEGRKDNSTDVASPYNKANIDQFKLNYLHVTLCGVCSIQQGLVRSPLDRQTAL